MAVASTPSIAADADLDDSSSDSSLQERPAKEGSLAPP